MRYRSTILAAVFLTILDTASGTAQSAAPTRSIFQETAFIGRSIATGFTAPLEWSTGDWLRVGGGIAALATLSLTDGAVRDASRRNRSSFGDDVARNVKPFGRMGSAIIVGGFLASGIVLDDSRARAVAIDAVAATLLTSALIIPALQHSIGRSRPWRHEGTHAFAPFGGGHSFPSGHAGQAFSVAAVIAHHYDAAWVDAVAYGGAGLVAASRVYHDAHHLSDVVASALIATVVGRAVVHMGAAERSAAAVRPAVDVRTVGFTVTF
jgi:membrane-associated phospholipid phosphatase